MVIFQNMASNKEWMIAPRLSIEYLQGVEEFLEFLRANKDGFIMLERS
jgi:hypothetical protein